jgi:hypothetical protein
MAVISAERTDILERRGSGLESARGWRERMYHSFLCLMRQRGYSLLRRLAGPVT